MYCAECCHAPQVCMEAPGCMAMRETFVAAVSLAGLQTDGLRPAYFQERLKPRGMCLGPRLKGVCDVLTNCLFFSGTLYFPPGLVDRLKEYGEQYENGSGIKTCTHIFAFSEQQ